MHHAPAASHGPDPAGRYKTRLGVALFIVYCCVYAGFVFANVHSEGRVMQLIVLWGLNLAVVYGIGLIVFAIVLAVIYNHLCTRKERECAEGTAGKLTATERSVQ